MRFTFLFFLLFCLTLTVKAQYRTPAQQQIFTYEDSLHRGIGSQKTVISGYGSAYYQRDFNQGRAVASLERAVLFVGHQFNQKISFFSELEVENALVAGQEVKGEIAMEQAFLKFNLNPHNYLVAGLFIPRIGILNENHLPVNFNGVERPLVETMVIPATWREVGVGLYGNMIRRPLSYSLALVNGLNNADFNHGTGIVDGRAEGSRATANNIAITAALQYTWPYVKAQVSGYVGGTTGLNHRGADSLGLNSGAFGTPLYLAEADVQWGRDGFSAKVLGTYLAFPDASMVDKAYAKNLSEKMYGAYAELGYDWLHAQHKQAQFVTFARYEMLDLNAGIPTEGIYDGTLKQQHLIAGFTYLPLPNVAIKADMRLVHTGEQNSALIINPAPNALPYRQNNSILNIGIGYSF